MYSSRLIRKKSEEKLNKILKKSNSNISNKLGTIFEIVSENFIELLNFDTKTLENKIKQISNDIEKLSRKKNTQKEISDLKSYKNEIITQLKKFNHETNKSDYKKKIEKKSRKIFDHSICVCHIAKKINKRIKTSLDERLIEYATIMHDSIKLVDSSYKHSLKGGDFLERLFEMGFLGDELTEHEVRITSKAIGLHNRSEKIYKGTEYSDEELLACIVHDADKISKIFKASFWKRNGKYLKVKEYERNITKIRKKLMLLDSEEILMNYLEDISSRNF